MGKTADWADLKKTVPDSFHNDRKTQEIIAKESGCSQSSVSKHIKLSRLRKYYRKR